MPTIFYNNLGYAYLKLKKYEEAGNAFDKYMGYKGCCRFSNFKTGNK